MQIVSSLDGEFDPVLPKNWQGIKPIEYTVNASGKLTLKNSEDQFYWSSKDEVLYIRAWYGGTKGFSAIPIKDITKETWPISAIQTDETFAQEDFLYAYAELAFSDEKVLKFNHALAKFTVNLFQSDFPVTSDSDVQVQLTGDGTTGWSIEGIFSGPIAKTYLVADSEGPVSDITLKKTSTPNEGAFASYDALVLTQSLLKRKLCITIKVDDKSYSWAIPSDVLLVVDAGKEYTFNITLNDDRLEVKVINGATWTSSGSENVTSKLLFEEFTANQLKPGDYLHRASDGTWAVSDGGLRKIDYTDGSMVIENVTPDLSKGSCLGIVFYVGHHEEDRSSYAATGIGERKCHGYAMALTDVGSMSWGPNNELANITMSPSSWSGFQNHTFFQLFGITKYPAAQGCNNYGGRYEAPSNSSGWFLPTCGQFRYLFSKSNLLTQRIDNCKTSLNDKNISWMDGSYWVSTEMNENWATQCSASGPGYEDKSARLKVRAVLAF